ncbi:unnamed protein product [Phytomonas sp. Hart1]|nr:unnamed protein product [Phytomonas sp. Hart1]|eukprot:CCW70039.1 unnamed protein product [Phytomonas sp. isolate Hart1]
MSTTTPIEKASPNSFGTTTLCDVCPDRGVNASLVSKSPVEEPASECLLGPSDIEHREPGVKPYAFAAPFAHLSIPMRGELYKVPHKPEKNENVVAWRGAVRPKMRENHQTCRVSQTPYAIKPKNHLNNMSELLQHHSSRLDHVYNNSLANHRRSNSGSDLVKINSPALATLPRSRPINSRGLHGCGTNFTHKITEGTKIMRRRHATNSLTYSEVPFVRIKNVDRLLKMDRELNDKKEEVHSLKKALRRAEMTARFSREAVMKSCGHMSLSGIHSDGAALIEPSYLAEKSIAPVSEDLIKRICFLEEKLTASLQEIDLLRRDRRTFRVHQLSLELQATESVLRQLLNRNLSSEQANGFEAAKFTSLQNANDYMKKDHSSSAPMSIIHDFGYYQVDGIEDTLKKEESIQQMSKQLNTLIQRKKSDEKETLQALAMLEKLRNENTLMTNELSVLRLLPENLVLQQQDLERTRTLLIQSDRQLDKYKQLFVKGVSLEEMQTVVEERDKFQRLLKEKNDQEAALRDEIETARVRSAHFDENMRMQIEKERSLASDREAKLCETLQQLEKKLARLMEITHFQSPDAMNGVGLHADQHLVPTQHHSRGEDSISPQSSVKYPTVEHMSDLHNLQGRLEASGYATHALAALGSDNSSPNNQLGAHTSSSTASLSESTQRLAKEESTTNPHEPHYSSSLSSEKPTPQSSRSFSVKSAPSIQGPLVSIVHLSAATSSNIDGSSVPEDKHSEDKELSKKELNHSRPSLLITEAPIFSGIGGVLEQKNSSIIEIHTAKYSMTSQVELVSPLIEGHLSDPHMTIPPPNTISNTTPIPPFSPQGVCQEDDVPLSPKVTTLPDVYPVTVLASSEKPSDFTEPGNADSGEADLTESKEDSWVNLAPSSIVTRPLPPTRETPGSSVHEGTHNDTGRHATRPSQSSSSAIDTKTVKSRHRGSEDLEEVVMTAMVPLRPFFTITAPTETAVTNTTDQISVGCVSLSPKQFPVGQRESFPFPNIGMKEGSDNLPQANSSASEGKNPNDIKLEGSLLSGIPPESSQAKMSSFADIENEADPQVNETKPSGSRTTEENEKHSVLSGKDEAVFISPLQPPAFVPVLPITDVMSDALIGENNISITQSDTKYLNGAVENASDVGPKACLNAMTEVAPKMHISELS